jgi:Spy/CpxP family protein refolding chaperone
MKKVHALFLALALVFFATASYAAPPDQGPANGPDPGVRARHMQHREFGAYLDLSKEQRDRMRDVWGRFQADTHDLKYDLMGRRLEMRKLFTDPKVDQTALAAKEKELSGLQQKLMERRTQAMLEWRSVLTPDQIRKLDRMPHRRGMEGGFGMM